MLSKYHKSRFISVWNSSINPFQLRDETSDKKHEEIRRLSSSLTEKNPKVFEPLLFSSKSVEKHVKNTKITGTWAEIVDVFSCPSLLKRPICTFSTKQRKWLNFRAVLNIDLISSIATKNQYRCPITLMYYAWWLFSNKPFQPPAALRLLLQCSSAWEYSIHCFKRFR